MNDRKKEQKNKEEKKKAKRSFFVFDSKILLWNCQVFLNELIALFIIITFSSTPQTEASSQT